jgi:pimeloyl-ACP methyl ester carboxylesterase
MKAMLDLSTVSFRDEKVAVLEVGSGPIIGYLHGPIGNPGRHPILEALGERHRVVAPCLPGFDLSPRCSDLRQFYDWVVATSEILDLTGLAGGPVLASSLGAMLALEVAAVRPEAFSHLVLVAPFGLWDDDEPTTDLFGRPAPEEFEMLLADPSIATPFYEYDETEAVEERIDAGVRVYQTRTSAAALLWGIPEYGLASRLHLVSRPVTLVWGSDDRLIPPSYIRRFSERLPNVVGSHVVEGGGHQAEWDRPAQVAAIVADALG